MKDNINLKGMTFYAFHGHIESERNNGIILEVDLELSLDLSKAMASDDLNDTVDYRKIYSTVKEVVMLNKHKLLEKVGVQIVTKLFSNFHLIDSITTTIRKLSPSVGGVVKNIEIKISRERKEIE